MEMREIMDAILKHHAAEENEKPFFVTNLTGLKKNINLWKTYLPNVEIFYAMKSNSDPVILKALREEGVAFDCASKKEIQMVLDIGVPTSKMILTHPIKSPKDLHFCQTNGVEIMVFDNKEELKKIKKFYPTAKLLLRHKPVKVVECSVDMSDKYGCEHSEVDELLGLASKLNLNIIGTSFHVGHNNKDPGNFVSTIQLSREVFDKAKMYGFNFELLDIGGGFPPSSEVKIFQEIGQAIADILKTEFPDTRVIGEPGLFMSDSVQAAAVCVIGKRCFKSGPSLTDEKTFLYYLNNGLFSSLWYTFTFNHSPIICRKDPGLPVYKSVLYGPTCAPMDKTNQEHQLPELEVGDWLYIENVGSYNSMIKSDFNGVGGPVHYYYSGRRHELLRRDSVHPLHCVPDMKVF